MPSLRPYQEEAIAAVLRARRAGERRLVVCLPTGAGKTVIFAELARLARRPVLVLAHRKELVEQAKSKLATALGDPAVVGVEQAGESAALSARVVVASLRSLHEQRMLRLISQRRFGLIVYDECHHATAEDNQRVLRTLGAFDANWDGTLLGFTATTLRADGVGLDQVFQRIVYRRSLSELIGQGYLVPLRGFRIATAADLVRVSASSDFNVQELSEAVDIESRNALVARSIQELARDRRCIAFCVTVKHARRLARALNAIGVPTGIVHGTLKADERAATLAAFRSGRLAAITNVGVLTEGFDDPGVSCIAMARPTRSEGLYAQCVGRGTRLAPGKKDCLVLDFVDLSGLSLVSLPTLAGLPPGLDLEGARLDEAERTLSALWDDHPGLELEPGSITLGEIQRRAAAFDPLTLQADSEVLAVSANAWQSLGSRGLVLHVAWGKRAAAANEISEVLLLDGAVPGSRPRGKRWQVTLNGKPLARFSQLAEAVEAVDYEVAARGREAASTALPGAAWRSAPPPPALIEALAQRTPALKASSHGEARALLAYATHGPQRAHRVAKA